MALVAVIGILERLYLSSLGENYDMESWWLVSGLVVQGDSVFAHTHRYNYGPIWGAILGCLRSLVILTGEDSIHRFHVLVAVFLSLIDLGIAVVLLRGFGLAAFSFMLLNPVNVLITGFHSQMDGIAILLALLFWQRFNASPSTPASNRQAGCLLGLSLMAKHMLVPFLPWIVVSERPTLKRIGTLVVVLGVGLALFAFGFMPWLFDEESRRGIASHVIRYTSTEGPSLIQAVYSFLCRLLPMLAVVPLRTFFITSLVLLGCLVVPRSPSRSYDLFLYLLALVALSSGTQDQYLAIPMCAAAASLRLWWSWAYTSLATATILVSSWNVGSRIGIPALEPLHEGLFIATQLAALGLLVRLTSLRSSPQ